MESTIRSNQACRRKYIQFFCVMYSTTDNVCDGLASEILIFVNAYTEEPIFY